MPLPLRSLVVLFLAAGFALPVAAQVGDPARGADRAAPDEEKREIVIERDGNVYRFRVPEDDRLLRRWRDGEHAFHADTVIDGRRVIRFRLPGGEEETFEFEVPDFDAEDFRLRVMPEIKRFRAAPLDRFLEHDGEPFGLRLRGLMDGQHGLDGLSEETRREMAMLERRTHERAAEARRAEGPAREEAERALDAALAELFERTGSAAVVEPRTHPAPAALVQIEAVGAGARARRTARPGGGDS